MKIDAFNIYENDVTFVCMCECLCVCGVDFFFSLNDLQT